MAKRRGFVKLDVDASRLFSASSTQETGAGSSILIMGRFGELLYGNADAFVGLIPNSAESDVPEATPTEVLVDGRKAILVSMGIEPYGWNAFLLFDGRELEARTSEIRWGIYLMMFGTLLLISFLAYGIASSLTGRIRFLVDKMEEVQHGDLSVRTVLGGKDEIGILDGHFNRMVQRLSQLIRNRYMLEIEKREAERNALQAQINPHFLYNTLETISAMAARKNAMEVCDLTHRLGVMFRYNIDPINHGYVLLEEELEHATNYVRILQTRHRDLFELYQLVEETAAKSRVLKFILQPIVENAVLHGFHDLPGGHSLEISAEVRNGCLHMVVRDDGITMASDKVEALNDSLGAQNLTITATAAPDVRAGGIGLRNVHQRLKLAFGDAYGIRIESQEGKGTTVHYTMPVQQGGLHDSTDPG